MNDSNDDQPDNLDWEALEDYLYDLLESLFKHPDNPLLEKGLIEVPRGLDIGRIVATVRRGACGRTCPDRDCSLRCIMPRGHSGLHWCGPHLWLRFF